MNLAALLTASAAWHGERPALRLDACDTSYRALDAASARLAGLLRTRGVRPGDRVGIMLPNVPEFAVAYYGVLRAGAVVVPMNTMLKPREAAYYLADSGARFVFAWHACAEAAEEAARHVGTESYFVTPGEFDRLLRTAEPGGEPLARTADDTAVILYTSGTTGKPKGAELTHENLARNACAVRDLNAYDADTVTLGALPLFHAFGQTGALNATLLAGGLLTLLERFDAGRALKVIERDRVSVVRGVPTMYAAMLAELRRTPVDTSSLRICVSGGAAMPVELMAEVERALGCRVLEGYGLSETSPVASSNPSSRPPRPGSIGVPVPGVEMKLLDEHDGVGEIAVRGHCVMKGYWNRPSETAEVIDADGWLRTGDLARVDEDGYFFIVDRKKDVILRAGYSVYPREVEEVLHEHPSVLEAAVFGVPDDVLGEEVAAAVRVGDDTGADELREFVRERVAGYKYPRQVRLVEELPKGPTGKVLKRELARAVVGAQKFAREVGVARPMRRP
jgi:long-chain acyl-CoA synthetase